MMICAVPVVLVGILWRRKLEVEVVDRVAFGNLSARHFRNAYAARHPVVVAGAWPAESWLPEDLAHTCGFARIRTFKYYKRSTQWASQVPVGDERLETYVEQFFRPNVSARPVPLLYGFEMSLKEQCPEMLEKLAVPAFFSDDAFHVVTNKSGLGWPSVLLGPEGSQTGLHIDTHRLPFWIAVVGPEGRPLKRVRVFSHEHEDIRHYGRQTETNNFHFDFDPWQPNLALYPKVAESTPRDALLFSGDLLYIPGGSPHAVINLADNVGVSMNFLDLKSLPSFAKSCRGAGESVLCQVLEGKGTWILDAMEERQRVGGARLDYFQLAGLRDRDEFCEVQGAARAATEIPHGLRSYCAFDVVVSNGT